MYNAMYTLMFNITMLFIRNNRNNYTGLVFVGAVVSQGNDINNNNNNKKKTTTNTLL